jgi:hypothetical protein
MSDGTEPSVSENNAMKPLSHGRVLKLMALLGLAGSVIGAALVSASFGTGILIGGLLAFANYYWLRNSMKKVFDLASETGEKPRLLGLKYFGRYLVLGSIVAILFATGAVSIGGLILGMGSFGFAVVLEGIIRIFSRPAPEGEN